MKIPLAPYRDRGGLLDSMTYFYQATRTYYQSCRRFAELQKIMKGQLLTTFFQPIYNLQDKGRLGYEVLNRPPVSVQFPTTDFFYDFIGHTDQVFNFDSADLHFHRCSDESAARI